MDADGEFAHVTVMGQTLAFSPIDAIIGVRLHTSVGTENPFISGCNRCHVI